ncbi:MAG: NlpC/P60 family protein [Cyclobacteriaceae bacterium]
MDIQNNNKEFFEEFRKIDKKKKLNTVLIIGVVVLITLGFTLLLLIDTRTQKSDNILLKNQLTENSSITRKLIEAIDDSVSSILVVTSQVNTPQVQMALELMNSTPEIPFIWGGKTEEGFDSSGFISYVLNKTHGLTNYKEYWSGSLKTKYGIAHDIQDISEGDIVFYESGVCMFYLGNDKCIGMVPAGILILNLENDWGYNGFGKVKN